MPKSKKRKKTSLSQKCPCCSRTFLRLQTHYQHSKFCRDFILGKDKSLISETNQLEKNNLERHNKKQKHNNIISTSNFDYNHTNDADSFLFEENNVDNVIDNIIDLENESDNDSNNDEDSEKSNTDECMEYDPNENYINTFHTNSNDIDAIDTQIQVLTNEINSKKVVSSSLMVECHDKEFLIDFRQYQVAVLRQVIHLPIDHSIISSIKLLNILQDGHISSCYYNKIISWHIDSLQVSTDINCSSISTLIKSKKRLLSLLHNIMYKHISPQLSLKPIHDVITLPSKMTTKISKFDLIGSLFSLLTDPELMKEDNINIYNEEFTNPNKNQTKEYKEIYHSKSFKIAHEKYCVKPNDVLIPIIPFIDGTPIDPYGRNNLEVVMFTLGIFNQQTRNKPSAWRVSGYIPNPSNSDSGEHLQHDLSHHKKTLSKRIDYHHMLSYILEDFVKLEQSDGILFDFPNENKTQMITYRLKFVILFIIGDAVGNDKLCDRFASYGKSVKRLCRDCDCPSDKLNNYKHQCKFTKRSELLNMSEQKLKDISYYKIPNNALDKLSFGYNEFGMNGCLPPEPLHQLNQGVFKKLLDYFDDCITSIGKETINNFVRYLSMNSHRQSSNEFPSIGMFKDGIDKCQLTGSEMMNKVFMLYLCLIQTYVIECLPELEAKVKNRFKSKKSKSSNIHVEFNEDDDSDNIVESVTITKHFYKKIGESRSHLKEWIKLFEATLCFDAWVHKESFDYLELKCTDPDKLDSKADMAVREYLKLYTKLIDDKVGNGTNTSKIHWVLHIPHYIREHGPPKVYSGQIPEHCLSPLVKWAARLTQLRPSTIVEQSCERYYENQLITRSVDILKQQNIFKIKPEQSNLFQTLKQQLKNNRKRSYSIIGRYRIYFNKNKKFSHYEWKSAKKKRKMNNVIIHNTDLINDVIKRFHQNDFGLQCNYIDCFTTLNFLDKDANEKCMFRADPYFYKRPWNDWCLSRWNVNDSHHLYPCRIMLFVDTSNMKFDSNISSFDKYIAIVRASENDDRNMIQKKNKDCLLIESFESDKYIRMISCNSIVSPIFVIPDVNEFSNIDNKQCFKASHRIMLKTKREWPKMFLNSSWN